MILEYPFEICSCPTKTDGHHRVCDRTRYPDTSNTNKTIFKTIKICIILKEIKKSM